MNDASKKQGRPRTRRKELSGQPASVSSKGPTDRSMRDRARRKQPTTSGTFDATTYRDRERPMRVEPVPQSPAPSNSDKLSNAAGSYEVGYGRPPKETQFKPGKSGNPKGRPPGSKNFSTILNNIMSRSLNVVVNGRPQRMSTIEALIEKLLRVALEKGDLPKTAYLLSRFEDNEVRAAAIAAQRVSAQADPELSEADLAILADHRRELLLAHLGDGADVDELMQKLGFAQDTGPLSDAAGHSGPFIDEGTRP